MDTPCWKNGQRFFTPLASQISQPPKRNEMIQNMRFMLAPPRPHQRGQYRYLHSLRRLFLGAIIESYTYQKRNYSLKCQRVTNYLTLKIAKKKTKVVRAWRAVCVVDRQRRVRLLTAWTSFSIHFHTTEKMTQHFSF